MSRRRMWTPCGVLLVGALWFAVPLAGANPPALSPAMAGEPFAKGPPIAPGPGAAPELADGEPLSADQQTALEQMDDIRDIRPPVVYGWDPRWGVGALVVALLAAGVGLLWWLLRRRRRGPASVVSRAPPVSLEEVARGELAALARESGLGDKEFYFRLCTAVRRYLDGRYGADTLERTTEELLPVLRGLPLDEVARGALQGLFRHADPIRYADGSAPVERRRADLAVAQELLRAPAAAAAGEWA